MRQSCRILRINKSHHFRQIGEVSNRPLLCGNSPSQKRENIRSELAVIRQILSRRSAKYARLLPFNMFSNKLPKLIDRCDRVDVTLALRLSPSKKSVSAQNNSIAAGIRGNRALQHHSQFKSGTLPRHPNEFMPESFVELAHLLGAI